MQVFSLISMRRTFQWIVKVTSGLGIGEWTLVLQKNPYKKAAVE